MPRSAKTGTEKKATKAAFKSARKREKVGLEAYRKGIAGLEGFAQGRGLLPETLQDISRQMAPQRNESLRQFDQLYAPDVRGQFGAGMGQGSRSSAMTQALAAARGNLESQIQAGLSAQMQQNQLANLNARMQAYGGLSGQQMNPLNANIAQQANYMPSSGQPSATKQAIGHGINLAANAAGTYFSGGNPMVGQAAQQGASMFTHKLTGGQQTPSFNMDFLNKPATTGTSIGGMNQMGG